MSIPYKFKHLKGVPVSIIPDGTLKNLIELDKDVQRIGKIEKRFRDAGFGVNFRTGQAIRNNNDILALINSSSGPDNIYPELNGWVDDGNPQERLQDDIDEELDDLVDDLDNSVVSPYGELDNVPGKVENAIRGYEHRAGNTLGENDVVEIMKNKKQGKTVDHDLVELGLKEPEPEEPADDPGENDGSSEDGSAGQDGSDVSPDTDLLPESTAGKVMLAAVVVLVLLGLEGSLQ